MNFGVQVIWKKVSQKDKIIFSVSFMILLLIHAFRLFSYIPNHDSFYYFYGGQDSLASGRWSLKYAAGISSYFDLQWVEGLLALIYIALTTVFICKILSIRNILLCCMVGGLVGGYPAVVCTFSYMYAADAYMLAMLLATLAVWLLTYNDWKKSVVASLLLGIGMGIYQAYISFSIVLILIWLLKGALIEQREVGKSAINAIASGIGGVSYMRQDCM